MTGFDYVVIGIVAVSLLFGLWRGVVGEVIALVAWGVGIFAAIEFGASVGHSVFAGLSDQALRTLAGCVVIFVGILVSMAVLNMVVRSMVKALGLSVSDRILGMIFGLARGVLVCMVLVGLGGMTSAPTQSWWKNATLAAPLETVVMAAKPWLPDDLAKRIRFS
ncbi:CvpA family protein [Ferribacterium limneticum]|uniref:CvpA family protein n=1 Tax=Ferribacterium limneticum TaxID=76259 RepID=UPI001CF8A76B|nr:CvpA family protein [Ferribacterium limneticum]UCV23904.1 CvpA family protein [Ferribacterium limneticum]